MMEQSAKGVGNENKPRHAPRQSSKQKEARYVTLDASEEGKTKYGLQETRDAAAAASSSSSSIPEDYELGESQKKDERWATLLPARAVASTPTSHMFVILILVIVFIVLVFTAGVRCATSGTCSTNKIPSLFALVYSMDTSLLTVAALCCLMGIHFVLNWALIHRLKEASTFVNILLMLAGLALYVMVFVSLIVPQWFVTFIPMSVTGLWALLVIVGLVVFFSRHGGKKKMFYVSAFLCVVYSLSVVLYIAFSAVPYEFVPQKDIGILVLELVMVCSLVAFCLSLLHYTRGVTFTVTVSPWKTE